MLSLVEVIIAQRAVASFAQHDKKPGCPRRNPFGSFDDVITLECRSHDANMKHVPQNAMCLLQFAFFYLLLQECCVSNPKF